MIYFCFGVVFNIFILVMIKRYYNEVEYYKDIIFIMYLFVNNFLVFIFVIFSMVVNVKFLKFYNYGNYFYIIFCKV